MERLNPVFTLDNECQDCYRCVRACPVKAIRVRDGHAQVLGSRCIACASCVRACPAHAKRVRNDLEKVRNLLLEHRNVYVSLAPSWRGPFEVDDARMIRLLKGLGFASVSETALGAQQVSIESARLVNQSGPGLYISGACPVIVDYVRMYKPEFADCILPIASPAMTHAKLLKEQYGSDIHVVFIGPCVGKKNEADRHPRLLNAALTFEELKLWLSEDAIEIPPLNATGPEDVFVPEAAHEGALYPLDGGMKTTMERVGMNDDVQMISVSGLELFSRALADIEPMQLRRPIFVEALACEGGCIGGPAILTPRSLFMMTSEVLDKAPFRAEVPKTADVVEKVVWQAEPVHRNRWTPVDIAGALRKLGKYRPEDELNCMSCGYHSCREMAAALLDGNAEPSMCASYMRKLAARRAAAMLKGMPSAVVMVDRDMKIIEANDSFVANFVPAVSGVSPQQLRERLPGKGVAAYLDWTELFRSVMKSGDELNREHYAWKNKFYEVRVFPLEQGESVGAIISDTASGRGGRDEHIAQRAREVITKNIAIVQEIACLLGEHMVETESLLSSIADLSDEPDASAPDAKKGV